MYYYEKYDLENNAQNVPEDFTMTVPAFPDNNISNMLPAYPNMEAMPRNGNSSNANNNADRPVTLPSYPDIPVFPGNAVPETLPSFPDIPVFPGNDFPTTLPSFPDIPVFPGNDFPTTLPSFPDIPVSPGIDFPTTLPSFPDIPVASPVPPVYPSVPITRYYNIRFLFAATGLYPIAVLVNGNIVVERLSYGNVTSYSLETPGSAIITIVNSNNHNEIVTRQMFNFNRGDIYTMAIVNDFQGFSLFSIQDSSCRKSLYNSCIRAVNLSYDTPSIDISLMDGRVVGRDIGFKEITSFRQFSPGQYRVLIYESGCTSSPVVRPQPRGNIQIIPIVISTNNGTCMTNLLLSASINVSPDQTYTLYVIGNSTTDPYLDILFVKSDLRN